MPGPVTGVVWWPAKVALAETVKQARQRPQTGKFQTAVAPRCPERAALPTPVFHEASGFVQPNPVGLMCRWILHLDATCVPAVAQP